METQTTNHKKNANKLMYLLGTHYGLGVWEIKQKSHSHHILHCVDNDMEIFITDDTMEFSFSQDDSDVFSFDCPQELFGFITSVK